MSCNNLIAETSQLYEPKDLTKYCRGNAKWITCRDNWQTVERLCHSCGSRCGTCSTVLQSPGQNWITVSKCYPSSVKRKYAAVERWWCFRLNKNNWYYWTGSGAVHIILGGFLDRTYSWETALLDGNESLWPMDVLELDRVVRSSLDGEGSPFTVSTCEMSFRNTEILKNISSTVNVVQLYRTKRVVIIAKTRQRLNLRWNISQGKA